VVGDWAATYGERVQNPLGRHPPSNPQKDPVLQITPNDAAEISKVIAVTIKAFDTAETAEFANGRDLAKQLTTEELLWIAAGGTPPRLLTVPLQQH
jgi:hypothetical protein